MRYPYNRLLLFYVSRKIDVNQALERYGLPPVGDIWIALAKSKLRKEAPYALKKYLDSDSRRLEARGGILEWAGEEGIRELWQVQKEFNGGPEPPTLNVSFRIFINPYSRSTMAMLLLSKASDDEIATIIKDKFDVRMPSGTLNLYRRIFWDIDTMGREAWDRFLPLLKTKHERHNLAVGFESPAVEEIRDAIGLDVAIEPERIVSRIAATAYLRYEQALKEPNPEAANVKMWMDGALKAAEQLHRMKPKSNEEIGLPTEGFKGLFSVQLSKMEHPTLAELQGEVIESAPPKARSGDQ